MLATAAALGPSSSAQDTAPAAAGSSALLQPDGPSVAAGVEAFLQACASRGAATALATLAHADLLPCGGADTAEGGPCALVLTLAHMFALGTRGRILHALDDTAIRTLLWLTEGLQSQYRTSARGAALDYCFLLSGCTLDEVLAVEVPAMVQLQMQVLTAAGWRVWVQPAELHAAAAALAAVGGGRLLAGVQAAVADVQADLQALQDQEGDAETATACMTSGDEIVAACILQEPQHHQQQQPGRPCAAITEPGAAAAQPPLAPQAPAAQPAGSSMRGSTTASSRTSKQQLLQLASSAAAVGRKRRRDQDRCPPVPGDEAACSTQRPPLPAKPKQQPQPAKKKAPSGLLAGFLMRAARSAHSYLLRGSG